MMEQGSVLDVSYEVELSEWFDWMRREIPQGGMDLPTEETSVLFAAKATQLAGRLHGIYRHIPNRLEQAFIKSAIVFQCWDQQKQIRLRSQSHATPRKLRSVDAERIIRPIGETGRHHLVLGDDGFQYVVTLCAGFGGDTTPATELICTELARMVGLRVPAAAVTLSASMARHAHASWPTWRKWGSRFSTEICSASRYLDSTPQGHFGLASEESAVGPRVLRQIRGALVFDIWTLNVRPRHITSTLSAVSSKVESVLVDHSHCLMDANWRNYSNSSRHTLASQESGLGVKRWEQLEPWLQRIQNLDMNPLWELSFQMPPNWYGGSMSDLANVLNKLQVRGTDIRQSVHQYIHAGYLPNIKKFCKCDQDSATGSATCAQKPA